MRSFPYAVKSTDIKGDLKTIKKWQFYYCRWCAYECVCAHVHAQCVTVACENVLFHLRPCTGEGALCWLETVLDENSARLPLVHRLYFFLLVSFSHPKWGFFFQTIDGISHIPAKVYVIPLKVNSSHLWLQRWFYFISIKPQRFTWLWKEYETEITALVNYCGLSSVVFPDGCFIFLYTFFFWKRRKIAGRFMYTKT